MIYLDNAATSYPKPNKVYDEMLRCMKEYCANPGRGGHTMSINSGKAVFAAREIISKFFNINNPISLCFTKNATESLNMAIKGVLKPNDHVVTTSIEHNSVIRPLKTLERDLGIKLSIIPSNEFGEVDINFIRKTLQQEPVKLVVCTLSSNVNGIIVPIKEIGEIVSQKDSLFLVDASQGAGSIKIDVKDMNIDMLAFPGHKGLLGPQGIGGLYVKEGIEINPIIQGGTGGSSENLFQPIYMPDMMESGTLNLPGIVGLRYAIEYVNGIGIENIRQHKHNLIKRLFEGLKNTEKINIYSSSDIENNSGIFAFNIKDVDSTEVSYVLDKVYNIMSRAGLHCAPFTHQVFGTLKSGMVRLSVGLFNTREEIDFTVKSLNEIIDSL